MKISLLSYEFINNNVKKNLGTIIDALQKANEEKVDLVVFGECFLQGFDSLQWDYENDQNIAFFLSSYEIRCIRTICRRCHVACAFGYFERCEKYIFSSYLFVGKDGDIVSNYQRRSVGWKEVNLCDEHYREGNAFEIFQYDGLRFACALCGDLWHDELLEQMSRLEVDVILWPIYVNFTAEQWKSEKEEYRKRVACLKPYVLLVNSYTKNPLSEGGSFVYKDGHILMEGNRGMPDKITVEIHSEMPNAQIQVE